MIAWHIDWLVRLLHHHHSTEDQYIWPLLAQRSDQEMLTARMEGEHEEIAACLDAVGKALEGWQAKGTVASRDALEYALQELIPPLRAHLTDEEQHIMPLMERYIGTAEVRRAVEAALTDVAPGEMALLWAC